MDELLADPAWWRALPLSARLDGRPHGTDEHLAYGRLRRELWNSGALSGGQPISLDRWERAGVSADALVELLAEPAESLAERLPAPEWLAVLRAAWTGSETTPARTDGPARPVDLLRPLVEWAQHELRTEVRSLPPDHPLLAPPTD